MDESQPQLPGDDELPRPSGTPERHRGQKSWDDTDHKDAKEGQGRDVVGHSESTVQGQDRRHPNEVDAERTTWMRARTCTQDSLSSAKGGHSGCQCVRRQKKIG